MISRLKRTGRLISSCFKQAGGWVRYGVNRYAFWATLIVLVAIGIGSTIAFELRHASPTTPQLVAQISEQDEKEAGLGIIVDTLDISRKVARIRPYYMLTPMLKHTIAGSQQEMSVLLWTAPPEETHPELPLRKSGNITYVTFIMGPEYPVPEQNSKQVVLDAPVSGNYKKFPFDVYELAVGAIMQTSRVSDLQPERSEEELNEIPFAFFIFDNVEDWKVTAEAGEYNSIMVTLQNVEDWKVTAEAGEYNSIMVTLQRERTYQGAILVLLFVLYLISALLVFMLIRGRQAGIGTTVSTLALLVGIPSFRIALVPSQIEGYTLFDIALVVPCLVLIGGIVVLTCSRLNQRID
jgi:hypothetical protein